MIKLIIFDLDGTLLNTIEDLADCTNFVLQKYGFQTHTINNYQYFVGSGVDVLLQKALPKDISKQMYSVIRDEFMKHYEIHKENKTAPFDGMVETLEYLQKKGILLAVATNKPQMLLPDLMHHYFPTIKWAAVFGNRKGLPVKPNPQIVLEILEHIQNNTSMYDITPSSPPVINKENILFVGDTDVDMETAKNAGITKVGALWGFRTKEELENAHADYLINTPKELIKLVSD